MQAESAEQAEAAWVQLEEFNSSYAEITETGESSGARYFVSDNWGEWSVIFIKGPAIGGVVNAGDGELAKRFVEAYLANEPFEETSDMGAGYNE